MQKKFQKTLKKKQEELLGETLKKIDIVICTALIPGKKAPLIIKESMINNMQPGSVIFDLAAVQGGNTAYTELDKVIDKNGIKIMVPGHIEVGTKIIIKPADGTYVEKSKL